MTAAAVALNLAFDPAGHKYTAGARQLASVTTILRETKFYEVPEWIKDDKYKKLGAAVHTACQLYDLGLSPAQPYHPDVEARLQWYRRFKQDTGFQGKVWEVPLADVDRGHAGTLDILGTVPSGEIWLVDIKTGTVPVVGVSMQLAAYLDLLQNGRVIPIPRHASLPLDTEWFEQWRRAPKIRRRSLNLTAEKYTLRSHDDSRWTGDWRATLRVYNAWQEHGI